MPWLPMDMPAEIRRLPLGAGAGDDEDVVARGPLVIMAYGLLAIDAEEQGQCSIRTPNGRLDARAAREVLRRWNSRH